MTYHTYVIQSECGRFYIGSTEDIEKRLSQHNNGISRWTSRYKNWRLVYSSSFETRKEALVFEKLLKKQKGGQGFYNLISNSSSGS
jgi:putative endonuclease